MPPKGTAVVALALGLFIAASARAAGAQARPSGADRVWSELGFGVALRSQQCPDCVRPRPIGGPVVSLSAGVTLRRGWGVAAQARVFQEFSFESSQGSRYGVILAQYAPPRFPALTLNAGPGWGTHRGDSAPYANNGSGAVLAVGVALRVPQRSVVGLSVTADLTQALSGSPGLRPRLVSVGLGLNLASIASVLANDADGRRIY